MTTETDRAVGSGMPFLGGLGCLAVEAMNEYPAGSRNDKKRDEEASKQRDESYEQLRATEDQESGR